MVFFRKSVLKMCSKFTGEHLCWSVIWIKLLCNFIEITLQHRCSPVKMLHIFRKFFLKNTSEGLLLEKVSQVIQLRIIKKRKDLSETESLVKYFLKILSKYLTDPTFPLLSWNSLRKNSFSKLSYLELFCKQLTIFVKSLIINSKIVQYRS